jgi:hypothetical protein
MKTLSHVLTDAPNKPVLPFLTFSMGSSLTKHCRLKIVSPEKGGLNRDSRDARALDACPLTWLGLAIQLFQRSPRTLQVRPRSDREKGKRGNQTRESTDDEQPLVCGEPGDDAT